MYLLAFELHQLFNLILFLQSFVVLLIGQLEFFSLRLLCRLCSVILVELGATSHCKALITFKFEDSFDVAYLFNLWSQIKHFFLGFCQFHGSFVHFFNLEPINMLFSLIYVLRDCIYFSTTSILNLFSYFLIYFKTHVFLESTLSLLLFETLTQSQLVLLSSVEHTSVLFILHPLVTENSNKGFLFIKSRFSIKNFVVVRTT